MAIPESRCVPDNTAESAWIGLAGVAEIHVDGTHVKLIASGLPGRLCRLS